MKIWKICVLNFSLRENKIYINIIIMLDPDEINTTLLVILILLVIFLIIIYFSVNYNQSQKANIINEKTNMLTQQVSGLRMDCPKCPSLECPIEKDCPDCNCPNVPRCPSCVKPKPSKCPDLKCPELKCPEVNISKDGVDVKCPVCQSLKCPDVKCPDVKYPANTIPPTTYQPQVSITPPLPHPQRFTSPPPEFPTPSPMRGMRPERTIKSEPSNSLELEPSKLLPIGSLNTPHMNKILGGMMGIGGGFQMDNKMRGSQMRGNQMGYQMGNQMGYQMGNQMGTQMGYQMGAQQRGNKISSGGYYPIQALTEKCPMKGYGTNQPDVLGSNVLGSNEPKERRPNIVQPSNTKPAVVGPDAIPKVNTDSEEIDLDSEEIDLDSEEIDLDSEEIDLYSEDVIEGFKINTGSSW
jgi:hypothetical protein